MDRITELRIFQRVARLGGFTRAADSLGISRATVTRTIHSLESRLGLTLLNRTTRAVSLSSAGIDFLSETDELLERCDGLFDRFQSRSVELSGVLRIASSTAFSEFFIAQTLESFQRKHPKLQLELITRLDDYSASSLIAHRIDLACCVANTAPDSVVSVRLGATESVVCAAPSVLQRWGIPKHPSELPPQALIPGGHPSHWVLCKADQKVTLVPQGPVAFPDAHLALKSALRSSGFALLPSVAVRNELASGKLVRVLSDWQAQTIGIFALLPSRIGADRRLSALVDYLRTALKTNSSEP